MLTETEQRINELKKKLLDFAEKRKNKQTDNGGYQMPDALFD
jgi:hypothetical protein